MPARATTPESIPPAPGGDAWRWVVVNSSGGKDSQTALRVTVEACDRAGIDRSRIVVSHQCLGAMEWEGTLDLVKAQAAHYGLRLMVTAYRDKEARELSLLEYVERRGKWPSPGNRYCTSEFKRGPGKRAVVALGREAAGPVLNVYGFRAEESAARAKRSRFISNARFSSAARPVFDWLPIHSWREAAVWDSIRESGVPFHRAYTLGMPRLSCAFCIFASADVLALAGRHNRALLDAYCETEARTGHDFKPGLSLQSIRAQLATV